MFAGALASLAALTGAFAGALAATSAHHVVATALAALAAALASLAALAALAGALAGATAALATHHVVTTSVAAAGAAVLAATILTATVATTTSDGSGCIVGAQEIHVFYTQLRDFLTQIVEVSFAPRI